MSIFISGLGWVTAAGMGAGRDQQSFSMTPARPATIERGDVFDRPYKNFGRMDEYSRLGLAAIAFALRDAGLEESGSQRDIGLVAQTDYGCLWTDIDYYRSVLPERGTMASPNLFAYTLPNCFMGEAAIRFGLTGESYIVNEPPVSGLTVLQLALDSIAAGESRTMICGRCDLGRPDLLQSTDEVPAGALFFVLESEMVASRSYYGKLVRTGEGKVFFNGESIPDLASLARKCVRVTHRL